MITEADIPKPVEGSIVDTDTLPPNPVAEFLGVEDNRFFVERSDGTVDTGWRAVALIEGPMGERAYGVVIRKDVTNEHGVVVDTLEKTVLVERLQEWQKKYEEQKSEAERQLSPAEQYTKQRLERLFAPPRVFGEQLESEVVSEAVELDYDYLFGDEDDLSDESQHASSGISVEKKVLSLHEEDVQKAEFELRGVMKDPDIKKIIDQYKGDFYRAKDMVELIRTNTDLRYQLGTHIIDLLDDGKCGVMPYRIARDDWKMPNHGGYEDLGGKVRSREYVAKLVLAMLDGTFDTSKSTQDPINIVRGDGLGQHRTAAKQVLSYLSQTKE
jgi:hypothetical protein